MYFTDARARSAISVSGNALSYNSSTGVITSNFEESPTFTGNVAISGNLTMNNAGNIQIGGYNRLTDLEAVLNEQFNKWDDAEGSNWRSVFGMTGANQSYVGEYQFVDDENASKFGPTEWYAYMSQEEGPIVSPYQQGHYIYTVIPGGQREWQNPATGEWQILECNECGPILVIADAYNPSKFYYVKSFN